MPKLTRTEDELHLALSGAVDFQGALAAVKSISGRRFDPDTKLWKFPLEPALAERILLTIKPSADQGLLNWVRGSRAEREQALTTSLPDDAPVLIPWGDRLYDYQRAGVSFLSRHPKAIVADDMGIGKTVQALSTVFESLMRYVNEEQGIDGQAVVHAGVGQEEPQEAPALQGLRDLAASGGNALGSRTWQETFLSWCVEKRKVEAGRNEASGNHGGTSEMRSSLPELPRTTPLLPAPVLVICPASALGVWPREASKWLGPEIPCVIIDGNSVKKREEQLKRGIKQHAICCVNWEQIRAQKITEEKVINHRDGTVSTQELIKWKMKQPLFSDTEWLAVIADEAHRAKNRKTAQSKGLYMLKAPVQLALTGTPLMNAPSELWSLLHWLYPEQYGRSDPNHPRTAYWRFHDEYTESYEGYGGSRVIIGVKNPDGLRFELKDRLVRRTKAQKLNLPEKTREIIPLTMNKAQAVAYADAETKFWLSIEQAIKEGDKDAKRFAADVLSGKKRIYEITNGASRVVRLRQILCTPALLGGVDDSAKLDAIVDSITDNSHQQHVVFTEFVEGANLLVARLRKKNIEAEAFTGEVSDTRVRTFYEDKFQAGNLDVLVGTLGAMRESITLTAANIVHFCEIAWVPGWNSQAEDRLHRVGQVNPVTVLRYMVENSVDTDKVAPTNQLKEMIVSDVIAMDEVRNV